MNTSYESLDDAEYLASRYFEAKIISIQNTAEKKCMAWEERKKAFKLFVLNNKELLQYLQANAIGKSLPCTYDIYTANIKSFTLLEASSKMPRLGLLGTYSSSFSFPISTLWELNGEVISRNKELFNIPSLNNPNQ